ncbi:hypothetical protein ACFO7V_00465 [Glutamicibacter bergerei]|uniref:Uncharacterized protein n=5 Tax=Glutamicibacter TaxID=1742989 RepID=A0ABV9MJ35_9MICC|nr:MULTISPECIES: hypothetical protein [Glutamicibacter]PCC30360.1 hypothetical protein CIK76_01685 [Glutamicibacter sp. BW80]CBT75031.1 hypothetical secreted protein [Glutamicibacter arilaitensis Re117]HBV10799.1 hypothetical protein [Micrococcaceae bacterium]HCM94288.1 hypothetical protein [Glutamicibacter sp.]
MTRTRPVAITLGTLLALALSGCTGGVETRAPAESNLQDLGQTKYAVYLSPPSTDLDAEKGSQGKVLLFEQDGSYQLVETDGMDNGLFAWNEKALFFSDMNNDYKIDDSGLEISPSPKTDSQNGMFSTDNGSSIGVYNDGFIENGYASQVVISSDGKSTLHEAEGNYFITSQCGDMIYGASRTTGRYTPPGELEKEPMMFAQLTGTKNGSEHVLGSSNLATEGAVVPDAPCVDGSVYYLSDASSQSIGDQPKPVLSAWDTRTGKYTEVPLTNVSNDEPLMRDDGTGLPQLGSASIRKGAIEWYGAGNAIFTTDLKTGETTHKFNVEGHTSQASSSQAVFTPSEVVQLVDNNDGSDYRIIAYDRDTGREVSRTVLPGLVDEFSNDLILRGFAVRP